MLQSVRFISSVRCCCRKQVGGGLSTALERHEALAASGGVGGAAAVLQQQAPFDRSASEGEVLSGHRPVKKLRPGAAACPSGSDAIASPPAGLAPVRCALLRAQALSELLGLTRLLSVPAKCTFTTAGNHGYRCFVHRYHSAQCI